MTAFQNEEFHSGTNANVQIWFCESCTSVHVRAANALLTFTKDEFASFTEAAVDCHYSTTYFDVRHDEEYIADDSFPRLISEIES